MTEDERFGEWFEIVEMLSEHCGYSNRSIQSFDRSAWREMYNEKMSPSEAVLTELSYERG